MGNFTDDEDRWNEFKNRFTEEDKASMESILKKTRINTDTGVDLSTTLTKQERTWTTNFAWRAFLWGFC